MAKKLIKHGNSSALIIDKALLQALNISKDTNLKITISGNSLVVTPVDAETSSKLVSERELVQKAFEEVMKEYAPALKKLAKN